MSNFQPKVKVERECFNIGNIGVYFTGTDEMDGFNIEKERILCVIEGTAKIIIDLCGYAFISNETKEQFVKEIEEFKASFKNAPDNFDDNDRKLIKSYVEELLNSYYKNQLIKFYHNDGVMRGQP